MKLSFCGAAQCITGSKHLLTLDSGKQVLLDCGLFQGMGRRTLALNKSWQLDAKSISVVILSHAHIDHTGLLPKLIKEGFNGRILCTPATKDLCAIMLLDCARIQEEDVKFINKKYRRLKKPLVDPLYTQAEAEKTLKFFETIDYNQPSTILENVELSFFDAGHILGSASVFLKVKENNKIHRILFSGDVGKSNSKIDTSPVKMPKADTVILESTYGNRCHYIPKTKDSLLLQTIKETCINRKGNLIIPAFSLGRTQELLFELNKLDLQNQLPPVRYFVDSPLSLRINDVIKKHQMTLNKEVRKIVKIDDDNDPFCFPALENITTVEESKTLRYMDEPFVVISSSGMGDAGRVKHHIANHIQNSKNTILMSGFASEYSLCGKLLAGKNVVSIFGVEYEVHASIKLLPGMSAHGDYNELTEYVDTQDPLHLKNIFLVHGESTGFDYMQEALKQKGFRKVYAPQLNESIVIS